MNVIMPEQVPVIPPPPWLQESEKAFKAGEAGLHSLGTNGEGNASIAWEEHKREQGYDSIIRPAFGKPSGPAEKVLAYSKRNRGVR